jgi:hypothetical protein
MRMSEEIQTPREFVLKAFEASLIEFDELYEELAK